MIPTFSEQNGDSYRIGFYVLNRTVVSEEWQPYVQRRVDRYQTSMTSLTGNAHNDWTAGLVALQVTFKPRELR